LRMANRCSMPAYNCGESLGAGAPGAVFGAVGTSAGDSCGEKEEDPTGAWAPPSEEAAEAEREAGDRLTQEKLAAVL